MVPCARAAGALAALCVSCSVSSILHVVFLDRAGVPPLNTTEHMEGAINSNQADGRYTRGYSGGGGCLTPAPALPIKRGSRRATPSRLCLKYIYNTPLHGAPEICFLLPRPLMIMIMMILLVLSKVEAKNGSFTPVYHDAAVTP